MGMSSGPARSLGKKVEGPGIGTNYISFNIQITVKGSPHMLK